MQLLGPTIGLEFFAVENFRGFVSHEYFAN